MTVWWCRGCGMEDTRSHTSCPSCASALQEADIEWLSEKERAPEIIFELELVSDERAAIVDALMSQKIRHRWEGPDGLVVTEADSDIVDSILDEVLGEDEGDDDSEEGDDMSADFEEEDSDIYLEADPYGSASDDGYDVLTRLFEATAKVLRNRETRDVDAFSDAANEILRSGTPFGVDEETWADIQSAARNLSMAMNNDSSAPIDADLKGLHNQLQTML